MSKQNPQILKALDAFRRHLPVAMPTETVYGLAAPVSDLKAIKAIFELKERPLFDPLIVHVNSLEMARSYARSWPEVCDLLAQHYWPGPLTLILPKNERVDDLITAGHPTVGLRIPGHPLALELIEALGEGVAAPSANKFSQTSPTCPQHVLQQFDRQILVLDGGECTLGIESTVCEVKEEIQQLLIYRPGPRGPKEMAHLLNEHGFSNYQIQYQKGPASPGQLSSHYRPQKPLLVYGKGIDREQALTVANKHWAGQTPFECSLPEDPYAAARALYKTLQGPQIVAQNYGIIILYAPINLQMDQWVAIKDRLEKAANLFLI